MGLKLLIKMIARIQGFTLLELLIAVTIVGILSAIAVPAYNGSVERSKNNLAVTHILAIQTCLERFYTGYYKYPQTLSEVASCLPNDGLDPWNNAYVYLNIADGGPGIKGEVRKDHKLNPINTRYDLYSMGKDGASKNQISQKDSLDDIILARDGAFIGLASDF